VATNRRSNWPRYIDSLRLKGPLAACGPRDLGRAGEGPGRGRPGVGARPRCRARIFFCFFFSTRSSRALKSKNTQKNETKPGNKKKHVVKQKTRGAVRRFLVPWAKQCDASAMCRPLESTAVRLATNRQGTSLDMPWRPADGPSNPVIAARVVVYKLHELGDAPVMSWK
jgi:hypothetical protein